ncbi:hypothetical protein KI387_003671, partial [Taxus chinensis]
VRHEDGLCSLPVDFLHFQKNCTIKDFYAALEIEPKEALLCMAAAVHESSFRGCFGSLYNILPVSA